MTIGLATTLGDYLEYAFAQHGRGARYLPVFDPAGKHVWPRRIAARLGLETVEVPARAEGAAPPGAGDCARDGREDHLVVALTDDAGFCAPALVFALAKDARLVRADTVSQVVKAALELPPGGYLTVVGPERVLEFALLNRLRREVPEVNTGVLCGPTPAKLSELVFKTLVYPHVPAERDEFFAGLLKGKEPMTSGRLTVYPTDAVDAGHLMDGTVLRRVLSFIAHASEDYLRVTPDDILCGLTDDPEEQAAARRAPGPLPACMQGDTCVYPDARRHDPAAITAQVVFANACLTLKFGTQLMGEHNRFTISRRFLDGWAGCFIASPLLKDGIPGENLLFHALIEDGLTVGAAVRAVNDNLERWGVDAPAVIVIGDPEAVYGDRGAPRTGPVPSVAYERDRATVRFDGLMPTYSRVRLDDPDLLAAHRDGTLDIRPATPFGGRTPFYAAAAEIDGGLDVMVLGVQDRPLLAEESPRVLDVRAAAPRAELDGLTRAFERYENLAFLDIKLDKGRAVLTDMVNNLPTMARRARNTRFELTEWERFSRSVERIQEKCAALDRGVMDKLLQATESREYHFVEAYRHTYTVQRTESTDDPCRYCGEALHRYVSGNILRPHLRRYLISCAICGAVQDTEDEAVTLTITGDNRLRPGADTELGVEIGNGGDEELDLLLGGRITHGKPHGFGFRLDDASVRVPAGGTARTRLTISTGRPLARHTMLLRFYAVGLGRIQFAGRDLYVR
ncbi:hypothetical protein [Streptomyces monomycini]|uniref:hypothetical protein n=1 Tax=Streptomyces monomycini TaxID=371720 RepID=UPI0004AB324A|nr:hypothetical protein [Streptomyces monomycini]